MNRYYRTPRPSGRRSLPKPKRLTEAQIAANAKRFQEAPFTVTGQFARDQLVTDGTEVYRVVTYGIRYHEDVDSRLYGVEKARAPAEWKATVFLRECIATVLREGMHEPMSGGAKKDASQMPVELPAELRWTDSLPGSLASHDYLTVHGDYVRAVRPIYDDAPLVAWMQDSALCKRVREALAIAPEPRHLPRVALRPRKKAEDRGEE